MLAHESPEAESVLAGSCREVAEDLAGHDRHGTAEVVARAIHGEAVVVTNVDQEQARGAKQGCLVAEAPLDVIEHFRVGAPDQLSALAGKQAKRRHLAARRDDFERCCLEKLVPAQILPDKFGDTFPFLLMTHGSLLVVGGLVKLPRV